MTPEEMTPQSREEELLIALLNDEPDPVADMEPRSNVEHYLKECIELVSCGNCPEPKSRVDILLRSLRDELISLRSEQDKYKNMVKQIIEGTITEIAQDDIIGVTKLKDYIFDGNGLKTIDIPDTVTSIGASALRYGKFETLVIPESVTELGYMSIAYCYNLNDIYFTKRITADSSFEHTLNIKNVYISDLTEWLESTIDGSMMRNVTGFKAKILLNNQLVENLITTPEATKVGMGVFYNYGFLKSAYITRNIAHIEGNAFNNCTALESIQFEEGKLTDIGGNAFSRTAIKTVQIPNSVRLIGISAFDRCANLTSITIGTGVTSIGGTAFSTCLIKTITMLPTSPPRLSSTTAFRENPIEQIIVPVGCAEAYKTATNWSEYADYIVEATE